MSQPSAALIRDLLAHTEAAIIDLRCLTIDCSGKSEEADFLMQQLAAFERIARGLQILLDSSKRLP